MANTKKLSLKTIAERAHCSTATVSNVLNKKGNYSTETETEIQRIIKELGYSVNFKARMLRTGKTQTIGVVFYRSNTDIFKNEYYLNLMHNLQKRLSEYNYELLISEFTPENVETKTPPNCIKYGKVDGVVLLGGFPEAAADIIKASEIKCVALGTYISGIDSITTNGFEATQRMVQTALLKGAKDLTYFAFDHDDYNTKERLGGFKNAVSKFAVQNAKVFDKFDTEAEAIEIFDQNFSKDIQNGAIFSCNDNLAIALMNHAKKLGYNIPAQISFFGYDSIQMSKITSPTLSTAVTDTHKMGEMGADAILARINNPEGDVFFKLLDTKIEYRESSLQ